MKIQVMTIEDDSSHSFKAISLNGRVEVLYVAGIYSFRVTYNGVTLNGIGYTLEAALSDFKVKASGLVALYNEITSNVSEINVINSKGKEVKND